MGKMPDKKLPAVPETILKRRKRQASARAERAKAIVAAKKTQHAKRKEVFQRAEKYVKQYREKERDELRLKREAKKNNGYYVEAEPKLAFVMRIRGINQAAPKVKKVLQLFRLLKINKATISMLWICEPYIALRTPNLK